MAASRLERGRKRRGEERRRRQFFECSRGGRRKEERHVEEGNEGGGEKKEREMDREEARSKTSWTNPQARYTRVAHIARRTKGPPQMQVQLCGSVHSLDFCDPFWGRRQKTCDGVRDWVETNDTLSLARNGHGVFSGRELLRASPPPPLSLSSGIPPPGERFIALVLHAGKGIKKYGEE